jgi:hypothetical protein
MQVEHILFDSDDFIFKYNKKLTAISARPFQNGGCSERPSTETMWLGPAKNRKQPLLLVCPKVAGATKPRISEKSYGIFPCNDLFTTWKFF